jgi:hypothetical protein
LSNVQNSELVGVAVGADVGADVGAVGSGAAVGGIEVVDAVGTLVEEVHVAENMVTVVQAPSLEL